MWRRVAALALAGLGVAATAGQPDATRVRHRNRFPTDLSVNSGSWILLPEDLAGLPDADCATCTLSPLGEFDRGRWYWHTNEETDPIPASTGQLIEVSPDGRTRLVWGLYIYSAHLPRADVLRLERLTYLHVPVRYEGTGALRDDFLFLWKGSHWQEIDTTSWLSHVGLPPCYGLWKGPFIEFKTMTLTSDVWIDGDGNCCPTGGTLSVTFTVRDDALTVVRSNHNLSKATGTPWDPGRNIDASRCERAPR